MTGSGLQRLVCPSSFLSFLLKRVRGRTGTGPPPASGNQNPAPPVRSIPHARIRQPDARDPFQSQSLESEIHREGGATNMTHTRPLVATVLSDAS